MLHSHGNDGLKDGIWLTDGLRLNDGIKDGIWLTDGLRLDDGFKDGIWLTDGLRLNDGLIDGTSEHDATAQKGPFIPGVVLNVHCELRSIL
jgi:hypothetical protein